MSDGLRAHGMDCMCSECLSPRADGLRADPPQGTATCPECGREVGVFKTNYGVLALMGHRPSLPPAPGMPWCNGGGSFAVPEGDTPPSETALGDDWDSRRSAGESE